MKEEPAFLPKMERINSRTMEMYRRLGIADKIREVGLRADCPMDVYVVTAMNEPPLLRLAYPSVEQARADTRATNDGSAPLEPYQLCSQYTLEPLLKQVAASLPAVTMRWGCEFVAFEQDEKGVATTVKTCAGETFVIHSDYMVGCDGGVSPVRHALNIRFRGESNLLALRQALFRCDALFDRLPIGNGPGRGRHYHVADDKATFLIMQDSTRHWTLHSALENDEQMKAMFEQVVGIPVDYEMLSCNPWRQNLMVAEKYGRGRVFLAGDAVHLVIPTGGLGMNSGVGDAVDLGWKLAGALQGWGGPNLLRSYELERRQIGDRNVGASRYANLGRRKWRSMWRPNIRENSPAGQQTRELLGMVADIEQRKTNEMIGAELGYRYIDSPIIMDIPGGPEQLFRDYQPSTWPGARLPHVWLDDGTPIQDHLPNSFVLLKLAGTKMDTRPLENAIAAYGTPLAVVEKPDRVAREVYGFDAILLRPDMHIVWRGNQAPDNAAEIAAVATGH